jgi:hypothetical protein
MAEHPAIDLWRRHQPSLPYPAGVIGVERAIPGTAFFPGGYGLWAAQAGRSLPQFPTGGVMVLGHDFHSEDGYRASLRHGRESPAQPTWRNLVDVLRRASIPLERCFFTNYFMGLRQGAQTTGVFPGARDEVFVTHCRSLLLDQLRTQRPSLILTLGVHTPGGIAPLSPQLGDWGAKRGFKYLDAVGPVRRDIEFEGVPGVVSTVVALTHPSFRHAAVRHRRFDALVGDEAEMAMLREARAGLKLAVV